MPVFRSIVLVAALSGLIVGVIVTAVQHLGTVPLILKAEVYEQAKAATPAAPAGAAHEHEHGAATLEATSAQAAHEHGEDEGWTPEDGLERNGFTALANVLTATGFALLLVAGYTLRGRPIGWRDGLLWGLAGFAVFTVAPSLGLPPELPGMPAAPLTPRQIWWIGTVAATATGLALLAFRALPLATLGALVLIVAPHLVGAPETDEPSTLVPETLAHQFTVAVTVTSFVFWVVLGAVTGFLYDRWTLGRDHALAASPP